MNKVLSSLVITGSLLVSGVVIAEDPVHEFSANIALTNDYRFRAISQTNEDPAISGGFDYFYTPLGFYAGVWASSLDFAVADPDDADIEIDYYGGFAGEFGGGLSWDIGGLYYSYAGSDTGPGSADYGYFEIYGSLSYDFGKFDVSAGVAYSPDYFAGSDEAVYVSGDIGTPLPHGFALSGHVGHQSIQDNAQFGTPDYLDWSIGVSKDINMFTFDLSYLDTDMSTGECFGGGDICSGAAIFTVSAGF